MSGLILTKKKPGVRLYIEISGFWITSMEELCYYLRNHIYVIDKTFFNQTFFSFLHDMEEERLLEKLNVDLLSGKHYTDLAGDVIESVTYYSEAEKAEILDEFRHIRNRTPAENAKARADLLYRQGMYQEAEKEYRFILEQPDLSENMAADVWNNMGILEIHGFHYEKAFDCFERAMDYTEKKEYLQHMIYALLLWEKQKRQYSEIDFEQKKKDMAIKYQFSEVMFEQFQDRIREERQRILESPDIRDFYNRAGIDTLKMWKEDYRKQEEENIT